MVALKLKAAAFVTIAASIGAALAAASIPRDGRSYRRSIQRRYSLRNNVWQRVCSDPLYSDGWFLRELRCSRETFDKIAYKVEVRWTIHHRLPNPSRTVFDIRQRVAVTLYHLTHTSSYSQSGAVFGVSKSRSILYVMQVTTVIIQSYGKETIFLPQNNDEWEEIFEGFEELSGIPGVAGCIDGSLFEINRPSDHEGWYSRKGFPAFNIQVVVDHKLRFRSYSIRSGSQNDQSIFNRSVFGKTCHLKIPSHAYFLADAGYKLMKHIITPYKIDVGMPDDEANFNYIHSKARITVERALGLLKIKFQRFRAPLIGDVNNIRRLIITAFIVHNWFINLNEPIPDLQHFDMNDNEEVQIQNPHVEGAEALRVRNCIKHYLYSSSN